MRERYIRLMITVCLVISMLGCSLLPRRQTETITLGDVVRLSRENVAPEAIIAKLKDSKTTFRLKADEILQLKEQGVDSQVLDYMLLAYIEEERRTTRWTDVTGFIIIAGISCLLCHADQMDPHGQCNEKEAACNM